MDSQKIKELIIQKEGEINKLKEEIILSKYK